jgi:penicillin-binding protein activator
MPRKPFFWLIFLFFVGCAPQVSHINPAAQVDLSGRWNDSDSRAVADQMISQLEGSVRYKEYASSKGSRPTIIVGTIRNKTSEHIDAGNYIKKLEAAIFNSGLADIVESGEFRDKLRVERVEQQDFADPATVAEWGKETGADLMLFGEMSSETDVYHNQRVVNYVTTLFLTDMESNQRIWYGQQEIKKLIRK